MGTQFEVKLSKIIEMHNLKTAYLPREAEEIVITTPEVNRPGLELAGFMDYFNKRKIQVMGNAEHAYLSHRQKVMNDVEHAHFSGGQEAVSGLLEPLFASGPVAVIMAHGNTPSQAVVDVAEKHGCPLLYTGEVTSSFVSALVADLTVELAPRITRHGVLVEVYGVGTLILGESGVGKSETAIELVKRGHRLIADDAVEIRRVSSQTLVGSSPKNIRHFMELRGIGIINVRRLFGIGAVKMTEKIDMIIQLEQWDSQKMYDRMGIDNTFTEILDNQISMLTIPVKPGRNLAVIIEVAAMNQRQKNMGYNAAYDLLNQLGIAGDIPEASAQASNLKAFD